MKEWLAKNFKGDKAIWAIILILGIFSMLAVYSASGTLAYKKMGGNTFHYLFRHTGFLIFGVAIVNGLHRVSYKVYYPLSKLLLYISLFLLPLTLIIGTNLNNANRWINIMGISFQPSDLAKFALILYIARILSSSQDKINNFKLVFKPIIIWVLIICMLILPANFSTAAMLFIISMILMFIGRIPLKYLVRLVGILVVALTLSFLIIKHVEPIRNMLPRFGTWVSRVENFMDSDAPVNSDENYQANQSKIAIVNGGLFGMGPGNSIQRNFLPHPYSDFIYSIIIEEYGLLGGLIVMLLYLGLLYRVGAIVRKCERTFPAFLVAGLAFSLVFQALINMAVAVNIFPVTGQTLPFVSMGGTSIIFTSGALGIILSVSRTVQLKTVENNDEHDEEIA